MQCSRRIRSGASVVELLVTISIVGMLTALLLPVIQAARETARRITCQNHLRQLGAAMMLHEANLGRLPSGGWGGGWLPDPERGSGHRQPGGWAHALLPYLERTDLHALGRGTTAESKRAAVAMLSATPLTVFHCPTRRDIAPYPISLSIAQRPFGSDPVQMAARCDYAANAGDQPRCEIAAYIGPATLSEGDDLSFAWPDVSDHTGVIYLRSETQPGHLRDGRSQTYLIAEKYVSPDGYYSGTDHGDDWSVYTGYQDDICRSAWFAPMLDGTAERWMPAECRFGSAHAGGWNAMFCDGAVRLLSFEIDLEVHARLANRKDAKTIDDTLLVP